MHDAPRKRFAFWRDEPHGDADGRAEIARLAEPAARRRGAHYRGGATRCSFGWKTPALLDEFRHELAEVRDLERTWAA